MSKLSIAIDMGAKNNGVLLVTADNNDIKEIILKNRRIYPYSKNI